MIAMAEWTWSTLWFDSLFGWLRATQHCGCNTKNSSRRWTETMSLSYPAADFRYGKW